MRRAFALVTLLTLVAAWRLLAHFGTSLPSDLGDPILSSWIFWWNTHAVPLTSAWWNAPMFAPMHGTFALSEAMIAMLPLSTPLQWLGVNPIATHNVVYLLSYPMAGVGAYALAFQLTKRQDASLIAALAFAFSPYRIGQLPHVQMQWSCWMPLALAALHAFIEPSSAKASEGKRRALIAFGVCFMLNGFTNGYFLVYFPILVGLWVLWFAREWRDRILIGATALIASLPIVPMLLGYAKWQHAFGFSRQIGEIRTFSADVFALFASSPRAWLAAHWTLSPGPEGELYPGAAILILTIVGVVMAMRSQALKSSRTTRVLGLVAAVAGVLAIVVMWSGGSQFHLGSLAISVHRPSRLLTGAFWLGVAALVSSRSMRRAWASQSVFAFYVLAAAVMYFFALGPEPHAGATQILYKPPYAWLMYLPGFDSVRVPARFGLLMIVCLTQAAALAFARLKKGPGVIIPIITPGPFFLLALAILSEGWIVMPVAALPPALVVPQKAKDAGALVLEMPVSSDYGPNTIALYNQLSHGRPIVNGFSGYLPPHFYTLAVALEYGDSTALDAVRAAGPVAAFVDASRDPKGEAAAMAAAAPGAEFLERTDRGVWYLLPGRVPPADQSSAGPQLTPARIAVTSFPQDVGALTDGDPKTRWHGHINQPGDVTTDTITLTYDRPVHADVLEIDQGLWADAYPPDLEVVVVTDAGEVTVFRGSLADQAIRGALASQAVVMKVPLANAPPARAIKLIGHPRGEKWTWSVGELRVFGK